MSVYLCQPRVPLLTASGDLTDDAVVALEEIFTRFDHNLDGVSVVFLRPWNVID